MPTSPRDDPRPPGPPAQAAWRRPEVVAAAIGLVMLAAQIGWLATNQRPVEYDDAWYLEHAVHFKRALAEEGVGALLERVRGAFKVKAPGVSLAAGLVMASIGESPRGAVAVSLLAWLLGSIYLMLLARRFLSPTGASLAAVLAASMPLSFALGRTLLVEAALSLTVVAFLFHAAASERMRRPCHLAGLVLWGAAGLLVKVSFPAYVVVPALVISAIPRRASRGAWARWGAIWAGVGLVSSGMAAWLWYADNWRTVLEYTRSVRSGAISVQYAVPVSTYLQAFALHAVSPWNLVGGLLLAGAVGARRGAGVRWPAVGVALAWIVPPALVLGASSARYVRYLAPLLPAAALILAALADPWLQRSRRHAAMLAGLLALPPLAYFAVASVPTPLAGAVRAWATAPWLGANVTSAEAPPDQRSWPISAIVAAAARAAGGEPPAVLRLNVDLPELNHNNLQLEAVLRRVPVVPAQIGQASPEGAIATALDGDLLLLQTGGAQVDDFLNVQRTVVAGELETGRHPYGEVASFELPGGRRVTLLARRCVIEDEPMAGPPLATLERGLELVSVEAARPAPRLVSVRTRYRATRWIHPMLAVRVEVAGPDGRVLGAGEHPLCRRPPRLWPAGTIVEDTVLMTAEAAEPGLGLRLGLRDLPTGAPLRVERLAPGIGGSADGTAVVIPRWSAGLGPPAPP